MDNSKFSYREAMKGTSLFGGVQIITIIIQIVRSKVIAILLGTAGMGVYGLLTNTIALISGFTNLGLGTSAVKDISAAYQAEDKQRIAIIVKCFRYLIWATGILGALVILVCSSWLSQMTFKNHDYTFAFVWLSITLLFNQLSVGQVTLLRGFRKLRNLAKANVLGSFFGLLFTLPLYYYLGISGIVPSLIVTSVISLLLSWWFSRKISIDSSVKVSPAQVITQGKGIIKMGFLISISVSFDVLAAYILRVFIAQTGGLEEVGLYFAGFVILNTYVGVVFNAISTDYYPRLSAIAQDNKLFRKCINEQIEIIILILTPILILFLTFIRWIIIVLYSKQFVNAEGMILWATLGILFKAPGWALGYALLAKSDMKNYFWSQLISTIYLIFFNIVGYKYGGLTGVGISFLISYVVYGIHIYLICKLNYEFSFNKNLKEIFAKQLGIIIICFLAVSFLLTIYSYIAGCILLLISGFYSLKELDKRMNLKEIWVNMRNKNNSNS